MTSSHHRIALCAVAAALAAASPAVLCAAAAAADVPGDAIVATAEGDAQIVWDSTPDIEDIVKNKLDDKSANDLLERDALRVVAANLKDLKKATSITVHVHYNKTGVVNPAYNGQTFLGVERYALVTIDARDASTDRGKWQQLGATSALPAFVKYKVSGLLPPR